MNSKNEHEIEVDLNDRSLAHSESFVDLREILEYLLRKDFISPEDADEAAAKFKTTYLTLQKKDRFLPFLEEFVAEAEASDEFPSDRIEALRDELEAFYDRMVSNFSIHRVAGYEDPDQVSKGKLSDDIDESFDFASTHKLNQNLFGPEIPEKLRPVITKVLEQISTFHDQKLANRIQLISKWRYLRLANQVEKLRRQAPALNTLQKYLLRKYGIFYKLKSFAQFQSTYSAYTSNEVLQKYKDEVATLRQQLSLNTSGISKQENGKKPHTEVEREIKNRDARIVELENELKTSLSTQNTKIVPDGSELSRLKTVLNEMEAKMHALKNDIIDKDKLLSVQNSAVKSPIKRRVRIAEATPEPEPTLKPVVIGDLNNNGKLRYFVKILSRLQFKLKASGYTSMIRQYTAHKRALQNVTDRIKGRLLIQTRLLNCGQDIRRSFLKWLIKANPDLLRECVTKIGVTAKLSHQVAIWRLKRLVFKPIHNKLPQAMLNIKILKGFFTLQNIIDMKNFIEIKNAVYTLNPNHKTKKILKIEAFINRIVKGSAKGKLRTALQALARNRKVQFNAISRIFGSSARNQEIAFMCLKLKGQHNKDVNFVRAVYSLYDQLSSNYVVNLHKVVSKLRVNKPQLAKSALNKLLDRHRSKLASGLTALQTNRNLLNSKERLEAARKTTQNANLINLFSKLGQRAAVKANTVVNILADHKTKIDHRNLTKEERLKRMLLRLRKCNLAKKQQALNELKLNCLSNRTKWKHLKKAFTHFFIKSKMAKRDVLNALRHNRLEHNNRKTIANKKVAYLLQKAVLANKTKAHAALVGLLTHKRKKAFDDAKIKDQLNYRLQHSANVTLRQTLRALIRNKEAYAQQMESRKKQQAVLALICGGQRRKMSTCLFHLIYHNKEEAIYRAKLDAIKTDILSTLCKKSGIKANNVLIELIRNRAETNAEIFNRRNKFNRLWDKLDDAVNGKSRRALQALREDAAAASNSEQRETMLKKIMLNGVLRSMKVKQNVAVSNLLQNNQAFGALETKNKSKQFALIRRIRLNVNDLRADVLNRLRNHNKQRGLEDEKRAILFRKAVVRAVENLSLKKQNALSALRKNRFESDKMNRLKNRLVNSLRAFSEKPKTCLFRLQLNARSALMADRLRTQRMRQAMGTLLQANKAKTRTAVSVLAFNSIIEADRQQLAEVENTYKSRLERRKRNGLLHLLVASLSGKTAKCLFSLAKFNESTKIKERDMMNIMRSRIDRLIANKHMRTRQALNILRRHKNDTKQAEKALFEEKEIVKNLLGRSSDPLETSKFNNFMRYIKTKESAAYSNPRFLKLCDFMKANNSTGNYKEVLELIAKGNITNLEELYEYITINNKQGHYKNVIEMYNTRNLEVDEIKNYLVLNNKTGKYTRIIQQIEANNFNKTDLINYIEKNNFNGELDELSAVIDGSNKLDDMVAYMKANNKNGLYKEPLQYLSNLSNPKLDDLVGYLKKNNKSGKYNELMDMIDGHDTKRKIQDVENYMRANNADGRYDKILNQIRRNSNLSDLYSYLNVHHDDPASREVLTQLDESKPKRELMEKLRLINYNGKYNDLVAMAENPNAKVSDVLNFINRNNVDNKYKDVLDIIDNPHSVAHYVSYMKENNVDERYNDVLVEIAGTKDPKLNTIISIVQKHNKDNNLSDVIGLINQNEHPDQLIDFIQKRNVDGKFNSLLVHLKNNPGNVITNIASFTGANNQNGQFNEIINKLNRDDEKNKVSEVIQFIKQSNRSGKYDSMVFELSNYKNPKMTDLMRVIDVHNKNGTFNELFQIIDNQPNDLTITDFMQYITNNNHKGEYNPLVEHLGSIPDPKISDAVNFIKRHNQDGKYDLLLKLINQEHIDDPINNTLVYLRNNNDNGRYDPLLKELEQRSDLRLVDILELIKKHNKNGDLNGLIKKLNDEKPKPSEDMLAYVNGCNIGGKFNGLIDFLKRKPNAKLSEILNYINNNNPDGRYNELLDVINGEILRPSRLLEYLKERNKDELFDELIKFMEANPNCKMTDIMDFIRTHNADGRYNPVLNYINNNGVEEYADEADVYFKFLSNARRRGEYPELFSYLEQNNMQDPEEILKYLKLNNKDGKYDDLINRTQDYLKLFNRVSKSAARGRFDLAAALSAKQRACVSALREHCKEQRWMLQHNNGLRRKLINALANTRMYQMAKALEKLILHKKVAANQEAKFKNAQIRLIGGFVRAQGDKIVSCIIRLKTHTRAVSTDLRKKQAACQVLANRLRNGVNVKVAVAIRSLDDHKVKARTRYSMVIIHLLSNFASKKKTVFHKLMGNSLIIEKERERSKASLYNILTIASQNKAICLNKLLQHSWEVREVEAKRISILVPAFNKIALANQFKAKSVIASLQGNSEDSKKYDEEIQQLLKSVLYKFTNNIRQVRSDVLHRLIQNNTTTQHKLHAQRRAIARLGFAKWKKSKDALAELRDNNRSVKAYYETNRQNIIASLSKFVNAKKALMTAAVSRLKANRSELVYKDMQRNERAKNVMWNFRISQLKKLRLAFNKLEILPKQHRVFKAAHDKLTGLVVHAKNAKLAKIINLLRAHNSETKISEEAQRLQLANLFKRLEGASERKAKLGITSIKVNNDEINRQRQRRAIVAGTIAKRLMDPYTKAQASALNDLRHYTADFLAKYGERRNKLKNLKSITQRYKAYIARKYLDALRDNAQTTKSEFEAKKKALGSINNLATKFNDFIKAKTLNGLRTHNKEQGDKQKEFMRALMLVGANRRKYRNFIKDKYLKMLIGNIKEAKVRDETFNRNVKLMFNRMLNSNELKKRDALRVLFKNSREQKLAESKRNRALKAIMTKRAANLSGLKAQALFVLKKNKENQIDKHRLVKAIQNNIFEKYVKVNEASKRWVLAQLRDNRNRVNKLNTTRLEVVRKLYIMNLLAKSRYALNQLRDYNVSIKNTLGRVLEKLPVKQSLKVNASLALLEANAVHKRHAEEVKRTKMLAIGKRLRDNQKSRLSQALRSLVNYNELIKGKARYLVLNLNDRHKGLKSQALKLLKDNAQRLKNAEDLKVNSTKILMSKLNANQAAKARTTITDLKVFSAVAQAKKQMTDDKLRSLLLRLSRAKLQSCLAKLVLHNKEMGMRENKMKNLLMKTSLQYKGAQKDIINRLTAHKERMVKKELAKEGVVHQLVQNVNRKTVGDALGLLKANKELRNHKMSQSLQTIKMKTQRVLSEHLNRLRLHKYLTKRTELNTYLTSLVFCIRKNHKANLRAAMDHWSNRKLKNSTNRMKDILERLVNVRNGQSYQTIKRDFYMKKYSKQIQSLLKFTRWVEDKQNSDLSRSYKHIKRLFTDTNPWFAKVVKILAVKSKPNFQISFWRLKYAKNLRNEHLSASDAIKFKKMLFILNKEVSKTLSFGFLRIQSQSDKAMKNSQHFGTSLIPRYK